MQRFHAEFKRKRKLQTSQPNYEQFPQKCLQFITHTSQEAIDKLEASDCPDYLVLAFVEDYLQGENYKESASCLAREASRLLRLELVNELVIGGRWDELLEYLARFTTFNDNPESASMFVAIHRERFHESLAVNDRALAAKILCEDLDMIKVRNEYCKFSEQLSGLKELKYDGPIRGRRNLSIFLQNSLKENLRFKPLPPFKDSALKNIIMGINLPVCTLNMEKPFEEKPKSPPPA